MYDCIASSTGDQPVAGTSSRRAARSRRTVAALTVTAGLVAALAPAAHAVTNVGSVGAVLTVAAQTGFANNITVNRAGTFTINDTGDVVMPGPNCLPVDANTVTCLTAGITTVNVTLGNLGDILNYNAAGVRGSFDGGPGNDVIQLAAGVPSSSLLGGSDNDTLVGGGGNDRLDGGPGSDTLGGGGGTADYADYRARVIPVIASINGANDDGQAGEMDNVQNDVEIIIGGSAADTLTGNNTPNTLTGGTGDDTLNGLGANDTLQGGIGNDTLVGGLANDTLEGGDGADTAVAEIVPDGSDQFNGGIGIDTVRYRARTASVSVSLDGVANDGDPGFLPSGELDNALTNVENVEGGSGADSLSGNASANVITGWTGNDTLWTVDGIMGNDVANGSAGVDTCTTDAGDVSMSCP